MKTFDIDDMNKLNCKMGAIVEKANSFVERRFKLPLKLIEKMIDTTRSIQNIAGLTNADLRAFADLRWSAHPNNVRQEGFVVQIVSDAREKFESFSMVCGSSLFDVWVAVDEVIRAENKKGRVAIVDWFPVESYLVVQVERIA